MVSLKAAIVKFVRLPKKTLLLGLIVSILMVGGLWWLYVNDKLGPLSPPRNKAPDPGTQVGPEPTQQNIPNFTPSDTIQVLPDDGGEEVPADNEPAAAG